MHQVAREETAVKLCMSLSGLLQHGLILFIISYTLFFLLINYSLTDMNCMLASARDDTVKLLDLRMNQVMSTCRWVLYIHVWY